MKHEALFNPDILTMETRAIGRNLAGLRITDPKAERSLERSLRRYGQLNPVVVAEVEPRKYELVDGHKRIHVLERILPEGTQARVRVIIGGPGSWKTAMLLLNWGVRSVSILEEALILSSMEEDGLNQGEIAKLVGRDKSWVCRRIALERRLHQTVKEHLGLGLIQASAGRELALLPRDNQVVVLEAIEEHRLTMRDIEKLIKKLSTQSKSLDTKAVDALVAEIRKPGASEPGNPAGPDPKPRRGVIDPRSALADALVAMEAGCRKVTELLSSGEWKPEKNLEAAVGAAVEAAEMSMDTLTHYYYKERD